MFEQLFFWTDSYRFLHHRKHTLQNTTQEPIRCLSTKLSKYLPINDLNILEQALGSTCRFLLDAVEDFAKNTLTQEMPLSTSQRFLCFPVIQRLQIPHEVHVATAVFTVKNPQLCCVIIILSYMGVYIQNTHRKSSHMQMGQPYILNQW